MMHAFATTLTLHSAIALLRRMMAADACITTEAQAAKEERYAARALKLRLGNDKSPCSMASLAGRFDMSVAVPKRTTSLCKRCFKKGTLEMVFATYAVEE